MGVAARPDPGPRRQRGATVLTGRPQASNPRSPSAVGYGDRVTLAPITVGDIAGAIAALAFAYLVWRLGTVIGKAGEILDETRLGVKGLSDGSMPLLGEVTTTVATTNEQLARIDTVTTNLAHMSSNVNALTSLFAATLGGPLVKVAAFSYGVRSAMGGRSARAADRASGERKGSGDVR